MAHPDKIHGAIQEMESDSFSERRWPGAGSCDVEEHRVYYSGSQSNEYRYKVGIVRVGLGAARDAPDGCVACKDKYPPSICTDTTDHSGEKVEEFHAQVTALLRKLPKQDLTRHGRLQRESGEKAHGRTHRIMGPEKKEREEKERC